MNDHPGERPPPSPSSPRQPRGLRILHEDQDLLVVDKASGLLSASYEGTHRDTAFHLLMDYVRKGNPKSKQRIHMVHRIDRDTSGVLVFAKNPAARAFLLDDWKNTRKKYCALLHGCLAEKTGTLISYLAEAPGHRMVSVPKGKGGQYARTGYRVLKETPRFSLVEIDLFTGRKNQIRAQFSEAGHPVVGDTKYGTVPVVAGTRLMLHAWTLTLNHPHSKKPVTFTAEIPASFTATLDGGRSATPRRAPPRRHPGRGKNLRD